MDTNEVTSLLVNENKGKWFQNTFEIFDVVRKKMNRNHLISIEIPFVDYIKENCPKLGNMKAEAIEYSIYEMNKYLKFFKQENSSVGNVIKLNDWIINNAKFFGDIKSINKYQLNILILEQIKSYLVGEWSDFKKNFHLSYFLSFFIENSENAIPNKFIGNTKELYLQELNNFLEQFNENTVKINDNKLSNLIKIWENLGVLNLIFNKKRIFAYSEFNRNLFKYISEKYSEKSKENSSLEEFFNYFDKKFVPLTFIKKSDKSTKIPEIFGNLILAYNGVYFKLSKMGGDLKIYSFPNGQQYKTIKFGVL